MAYSVIVKKNASIPDTLKLINIAVNIQSRSPFVKELTRQLNPTGDKYAFIKRLFDWVCTHVKYKLDAAGDEEIWSPELTYKKGVGDCKKMTTLIASVLKCAGIEPVLKHVGYKDSANTHIYVIVPFPDLNNYLVVDPVNYQQWNKEVEHSKASLNFLNGKQMNLHMMGNVPRKRLHAPQDWKQHIKKCVGEVDDDIAGIAGTDLAEVNGAKADVLQEALMGDFGIIGMNEDEIMSGIGRRKKKTATQKRAAKAKRKARREKLFHVFKAVNLAPSRAAFLLLVRTNVFKLANRMAKAWIHDPTALKKMWNKFGGNPEKLKEAIKKGAHKKPELASQIKGIAGMNYTPSVDEMEGLEVSGQMGSVEGIGSATAIAAAIAAATPIVIAVIKIVGKSKDKQDTGESSPAEDIAEGVQKGASSYAESGEPEAEESTEGIGYMSEVDDIAGIGEAFDYVDGMGRKRKKNKKKRKKKHEEEESAAVQEEGLPEVAEKKKTRKKLKISDDDIKTLSTLAEYGTRKILKGQITKAQMNDIKLPEGSDGGTQDTPLTQVKDAVSEANNVLNPKPPTAGSFGLSEINNFPTFLHWLKGCAVLSFGGQAIPMIPAVITIVSFVYLTRKISIYYLNRILTFKL